MSPQANESDARFGALRGLRILDLSWGVAGPLGVLMLAEQGADAIKVEPPGGIPWRDSSGSHVWNRSRRSITLDLKTARGRESLLGLIETADVLVESFRPGVMDRLGVGYAAASGRNPRLVYCSVPAYPEGHRNAQRAGYDALVQAASGQQLDQPGWRMGPIFLHMPMPSMGACFLVPTGILAALYRREHTGRGQHVRTSLLQGVFLYTSQIWQALEHSDPVTHEIMGKTYPMGIHQPMIFETADGWIHNSMLSGLTPSRSQDDIVGLTDLPTGQAMTSLLPEERERIAEMRRAAFRGWKTAELAAVMRSHNHAVEPIITMEEALGAGGAPHAQLLANRMIATVDDPVLGSTTQIGVPLHHATTPGAIQSPQPLLGQHTTEILTELTHQRSPGGMAGGQGPARDNTAPGGMAGGQGPATVNTANTVLGGVRLIDFGQYLAGPFGPMVIGDLGAEVIKVEPIGGDNMRGVVKPFLGCQRGKRSIAVNLKTPEGLEIGLALVARADVVHHNMTKGVADKLGIGYEHCKAVNPDVIYCNTYAYGLEGPLSHFGGLDPLYQAAAGLEFEAGAVHEGNPPLYYRFGMCDTANAMLSVVGVLSALVHRARTGEAQELWTSLLDGGAVFASDAMLVDGQPVPRRRLDRGQHGLGPGYRLYRTQDDAWIQIAAVTDPQWAALCRTVGAPELLDDERSPTPDVSAADRAGVEAMLERCFLARTAWSWHLYLDEAGVPNELPLDTQHGIAPLYDADNVALGLVTEYEHPTFGRHRQVGTLIDFSETPGHIAGPAPLVGQHSREILEWLGYPPSRIDELIAAGIVQQSP
jgi:crotonobetainyl-CoA:carnitine CoA-transferase CaiB-like acyl-CoA transferase